MSHEYNVCCRCGVKSEYWNHAENELIKAIQACYPAYLCFQAGWGVHGLEWDGYLFEGLAGFLVDHFDHGGFTVKGEYDSDVPVTVVPAAPSGVYESVCAERLKTEVKEMERRLALIKEGLSS